jgi:hypothetical protein
MKIIKNLYLLALAVLAIVAAPAAFAHVDLTVSVVNYCKIPVTVIVENQDKDSIPARGGNQAFTVEAATGDDAKIVRVKDIHDGGRGYAMWGISMKSGDGTISQYLNTHVTYDYVHIVNTVQNNHPVPQAYAVIRAGDSWDYFTVVNAGKDGGPRSTDDTAYMQEVILYPCGGANEKDMDKLRTPEPKVRHQKL